MIAATFANLQGRKKYKPQDFYPNSPRKNRIQLSPRQERQLKEKREREKRTKAKKSG